MWKTRETFNIKGVTFIDMKSSSLPDFSRTRCTFNVSSFIAVISLALLVLSSSGALVPLADREDMPSMARVSGTRDGQELEVRVLLINASNVSTPLFREIISGNSTYNLTEQREGETDPSEWGDHDILVWAQGRKDRNASLESELREYVVSGGHLLIEGANVAEHAGSTEFEDDVIHASSIDVPPLNHYVGQNLTKFTPAHPVASKPNDLSDPIEFTSNQTSRLDSDVCDPENGSVVVLEWEQITNVNSSTVDNSNNYGGVFAFDDDSNLSNGGQVLFFSFGIGLIMDGTDRTELVENAMDWLVPIEIEEYYAFYLTPDTQEKTTNSGGTVIYDILVINNGTLDDTIDLFNSAPPPGWSANLNQTSVEVDAGRNTSVSLRVTAPVSAQNGDYANISVWGQSQGNGDLTYTVHTNTTVNNEARADLEPLDIGPDHGEMVLGMMTTITSLVRNGGDRDADNVIVTFYLDDNSSFPIGNDTIDVPAGEETRAVIQWNATEFLGDHHLIVWVDSGQNHPETNESNNELENETGDWIVKNHVAWNDASYNLTGNLSVAGAFLLDNVTILFNSTDGAYGFYIENPGILDAERSLFAPLGNGGDSTFLFQVRGMVTLLDSEVTRTYYNGDLGDPRGGIEIYSSTVDLDNTTISDTGLGIWTSVSPTIRNSTFENISDFGIYSLSGSPTISQSTFSGMTTAIVQKGGAPIIQGCEITDVSTGIYLDQMATGLINMNDIHDLNGLERGILISDSSPLVTNNEINGVATAIWVQGEDAFPMIFWNDLSGNTHNSAYCDEAYPTFEGNIISENGRYGINVIGGGVTVRNSIITNNLKRAILVYDAELTIDNVTFQGNDNSNEYDEGIYAYDTLIRLYNSTFDKYSFDLDMNLTHSSILQSINSTYDTINRTGGSILSLGWFLNIVAVDRSDQPLPGADVVIRDTNDVVVFQGGTDGKGRADLIPLISFSESDDSRGTREWFTPHRIDVDFGGGNGNTTVNLSEYTTLEIEVNRPPVASLDVNKQEGTSETIFLFSGEGSSDDSSSIAFYKFDFGNGETTGWTDKDSTSHTFSYAGMFTVTLLVKDYAGAVSDPDSLVVTVNNPPQVNLPDSITSKQDVAIEFDADVYDPDSWDNLHYEWDFGDGHNSTLISPTHAYGEMGNYIVVLTVTDDHGGEGDDLMTVKIQQNRRPEADAGKNINITFNNGANVQFTSYSTDDDGDPLTYLWDFEDGFTSEQENPNHYYNDPGTFNVTLTVTDDSNAQDTDTIQVNVIEYRITFRDVPMLEGHQGSTPKTFMILQNNGSHPVVVNLTYPDMPAGWVSISSTTLYNITLDLEESWSVTVTITIPSNAQMGISEQYLWVEAGGIEFRGSILVDVKKQAKVSLELLSPTTQSGNPGDTLTYNLKVVNGGSDEDSFNLQVSSFPPGWVVLIKGSSSATVDNISPNLPGNFIIIQISIEIPQGEIPGRQTVSILASSVSDAAATASVDIKTTVNDGGDNGDDSSGISLFMVSALVVVLIIIGAIIMSRRKQDLRFAEDEEDDGFVEDWDESPEPVAKPKKKTEESATSKPRILKCPKCATLLEVPSAKRPITIQCPGCGARAHIKK